MIKFNKKKISYFLAAVLLFSFLASRITALNIPVFTVLKYPLVLCNLLKREIQGIAFYHDNYLQNERLNKENQFLRRQLNEASEIYLENKRLRQALSFKEKSSHRVVVARVIAHSGDNWSSVIIIDKGSANGIKKGRAVINHLGLVGRVIETSRAASKIMLINDPDLGISAIIQRSRQEGLVCGSLGNSLMMKYLPENCDIQPGDVILTSGLGEAYPKGLVIGTVVSVGNEFSGLSHYAVIKPVVDLASLEEVLVIVE